MPEKKRITLIVKPLGGSRYHITEINECADIVSPFLDQKVIYALNLTFNLAYCYEMYALIRRIDDKRNIIGIICNGETRWDLAIQISEAFDFQ